MAADGGGTPAASTPQEADWVLRGEVPRPSTLHPPTRSVEPWTEEAWIFMVDYSPSAAASGVLLLNGGILMSQYRRYPDRYVGTTGSVNKPNVTLAEWAPIGTWNNEQYYLNPNYDCQGNIAFGTFMASSLSQRMRMAHHLSMNFVALRALYDNASTPCSSPVEVNDTLRQLTVWPSRPIASQWAQSHVQDQESNQALDSSLIE